MKKQASKFTALLLCGVLALSLTACGTNDKPAPTPDANAKPSYTAGTYTGTANGMKGEISVDVTVSADAITDVTVKSHQETYGIGYGLETSPVEVLPKQIVETQSLGVDNITGATITTAAIKNAVASAVTEAGGDAEALKNVPVEKNPEDLTLDADVVIAGAGAAGLAAGIEACLRRSCPLFCKIHHSGKAGCDWRRHNPQRRQALGCRNRMAEKAGL